MMDNLWIQNTPAGFWKIMDHVPQDEWDKSIEESKHLLGCEFENVRTADLAEMILGEGQFGKKHFELSLAKKCYYLVKPLIPRNLSCWMRKVYGQPCQELAWPVEDRLVRFLWELPKKILMNQSDGYSFNFIHFWPYGKRFSFILTHDVETVEGLKHIREIMDLEEAHGFRSSFNFIPERYQVPQQLLDEMYRRGFEVGIHGLKHDGKLFNSQSTFARRAKKINRYVKEFHAKGFRSPLMQRNPDWMQCLDVEYDLSFFDTDPFEAISGGTMSIYPYQLGNFVELPYTLVQDYSLQEILCETTPQIWLDKVDFIQKYHGMALVNVHPDYLILHNNWNIYEEFLDNMKNRVDYWHALPCEAASWWKSRTHVASIDELETAKAGTMTLEENRLLIDH